MNSLSDLNGYASEQVLIPHDFRPPLLAFTNNILSATCYENLTFASPSQDLTKIINVNLPFSVSINTASVPGTTVAWGNTVPTHGGVITVTAANGVSTLNGLTSIPDWNAIKNPIIDMGINPPDIWTYVTTVNFTDSNSTPHSQSWNTTVSVVQLDQLTTTSPHYYNDSSTEKVLNNSTVYALGIGESNGNLTVGVSPSINTPVISMSSSGTGGTSFYDPSTHTLGITGNLTQVNSHLSNMYITSAGTGVYEGSWNLNYTLYNPSTNFTSNMSQILSSYSSRYLSASSTFYYDEDVPSTVTGYPSITDLTGTGNTYTLDISCTTPALPIINFTSTGGSGGTVSYNSTTKVLTIAGTKTQVNSWLPGLKVQATTDYRGQLDLFYVLHVSTGVVATRVQTGYVSASDTNIVNMIARTFVSNTVDQYIFASTTPYIAEQVTTFIPSYTISFGTTAGRFGTSHSNLSANFSITGGRDYINSIFPTIMFVPNKNVTGPQSFVYTQMRNGSTQEFFAVSLTGTNRTSNIAGVGVTTITSDQTFTLTFEQSLYLNTDILVVGGGGGGGAIVGGGGGGGEVIALSNVSLPSGTLNITIGTGGNGQIQNYPTTTGNTYHGTKGGNTSILNGNVTVYNARGGNYAYGALGDPSGTPADGVGGASGNGNNYGLGGAAIFVCNSSPYTTLISGAGGGGGGAGGIGGNISGSYPYTFKGGNGGPGVTSSITGTAVQYGRGGGGAGQYDATMASAYGNVSLFTGQIGGTPNGGNGNSHVATGTIGSNYGDGGGGQSGLYYGRRQKNPSPPQYELMFTGTGGAGKQGVVVIKLY